MNCTFGVGSISLPMLCLETETLVCPNLKNLRKKSKNYVLVERHINEPFMMKVLSDMVLGGRQKLLSGFLPKNP